MVNRSKIIVDVKKTGKGRVYFSSIKRHLHHRLDRRRRLEEPRRYQQLERPHINVDRCQFQHILSTPFLSSSALHSFSLITIWLRNFLSARILAQKLLVKCWWNWLQVGLKTVCKRRLEVSWFMHLSRRSLRKRKKPRNGMNFRCQIHGDNT